MSLLSIYLEHIAEIYIFGHWRRPTNCLTNNCSGSYLWHFLSKNQHCSRQISRWYFWKYFRLQLFKIFLESKQFFKLFHQNINVHENFLSFLQYLYLFKYLSSEHLYINVQEKSLFCSALHFESTLCRRSHVSFSKWSWPLRVSNQMPIDPSTTTQTYKRRKNHYEYILPPSEKISTKTRKLRKWD